MVVFGLLACAKWCCTVLPAGTRQRLKQSPMPALPDPPSRRTCSCRKLVLARWWRTPLALRSRLVSFLLINLRFSVTSRHLRIAWKPSRCRRDSQDPPCCRCRWRRHRGTGAGTMARAVMVSSGLLVNVTFLGLQRNNQSRTAELAYICRRGYLDEWSWRSFYAVWPFCVCGAIGTCCSRGVCVGDSRDTALVTHQLCKSW